ncbi:Cysteine protein inhibitor [Dorcoceras hygrometricum]|uniref:Cysteine protein inhibitor n=1 Tax=Dorcoceras hygrometricum TaxID=472368 RepID=A0A2Z7A3D2_9LAMI|nr:Cysteine protein inhibitor [Dorcoceras hygrometricum]
MELKSCPLLSAPIKDLSSPEVLDIARFAVTENNKRGEAKLQFVKVVKGESQVVAGVNYKLVIAASDATAGNAPGNYEAVVWDKLAAHSRQLVSFKKV